MKIHHIKMYQEYNAPIEKVFEAFGDHANMGKILGQKITRIVDSKDANNINGVGSVRKIHIPLFGFEETIRKCEKPNRIEYQISKGSPLSHHYGTMIFTSLPNGKTSLDYSIELGSKLPLMGVILQNALNTLIGGSIKKYAKKMEA
jgi:uncharacterized protein YndB with AHSA1/START domain